MAHAESLSPAIWNALADAFDKGEANREIVIGKVVRRDNTRKLVWLEAYGDLAIPLVAFSRSFSYYDTDASGVSQKRSDPTGDNTAYQTVMITPRVGEIVIILDPGGQHRFPLCVGVLQSTGYWQGEG